MTDPSREVVLDTNVFGPIFVRRGAAIDPAAARWRDVLRARPIAVAFQRQELLYGALKADWAEARIARLRQQLASTVTIWPDVAVVETCARLRTTCQTTGHPLHQRRHAADLWIAACAMAHGLPLATEDTIFQGVAGLELLSRDAGDDPEPGSNRNG